MDAIRSCRRPTQKRHNECRKSRNEAITIKVNELICQLPIGTKIYTRQFAQSLGKVKGWLVEPTHMRRFLRERDDLIYDKKYYVKVK